VITRLEEILRRSSNQPGQRVPDPEFGWGHDCKAEFTQPLVLLGPHSAPLGMRFYTGHMFPAAYRGAILIARHGSWNKSNKFGGDVVVVKLNKDGTVRSVEPFNSYIGRPADLHVMKDGSVSPTIGMARSIASPTAAARLSVADWVQTPGTLSVSPMSSQNQMLDATKCARGDLVGIATKQG
jgi:hypothetical protein